MITFYCNIHIFYDPYFQVKLTKIFDLKDSNTECDDEQQLPAAPTTGTSNLL